MATEMTTITTAPDGTTTVMTDGSPHGAAVGHNELDGGSVVVGMIAAVLGLGVVKAWKRIRRVRVVPEHDEPDAAARELAALRQRTAVLERIVTDPAARVAHEIDGLRQDWTGR